MDHMPEHNISAHVSDVTAAALILLAGGEAARRGGWNLYGKHYWQTDEALTVALEEIAANELAR
jgi:hypothetical protein